MEKHQTCYRPETLQVVGQIVVLVQHGGASRRTHHFGTLCHMVVDDNCVWRYDDRWVAPYTDTPEGIESNGVLYVFELVPDSESSVIKEESGIERGRVRVSAATKQDTG